MKMPSKNWLYLDKGEKGKKTWNDDEIKMRPFVHGQSIGLVDTIFAIRLDHNKRKKLLDRFTMIANYPIESRRKKSKRS
jgi:hypothetical protein